MQAKNGRGGNPTGQKQDGRDPSDRNPEKNRKRAGSHGSQAGPKGSKPDKHGGSGAGRQEGGSGAGRER